MKRSTTATGDRYDQAAEWHARLGRQDVAETDRREFERWHATPENAAAYAAITRTWEAAERLSGRVDGTAGARVSVLLDDARAEGPRRPSRHGSAVAALALLVILGVAVWALVAPLAPRPNPTASADETSATYVTAVGERSTLTLNDGSQVELNTSSRLSVEFGPDLRRVTLRDGQALFDVAHDPDRPFVVEAGSHRVVALGTSFDVRRNAGSVQVTLIEGSVRVEESTTTRARATRLDPGQQFVAADDGAEVRSARVEQVTSWRDGRLIFSDEPLGHAVAEVNRYSTRKIVLADPELAALRLSGVFRTGRPDSFVDAVTSYFSITSSRSSPDGDLVLHARSG